ncbi:MAG: hypothetical protein M8353_05395 [ANME-2 cluster archaeon]|nr:hypothetical protein [ANME-2 cluster archaeon]
MKKKVTTAQMLGIITLITVWFFIGISIINTSHIPATRWYIFILLVIQLFIALFIGFSIKSWQ